MITNQIECFQVSGPSYQLVHRERRYGGGGVHIWTGVSGSCGTPK